MEKRHLTLVTFGNGGVLVGVDWYNIHGKDLPCVRLDPLTEKHPIGETLGGDYEEIEKAGEINNDSDCVLLSFSKVESVDVMLRALTAVRVALTSEDSSKEPESNPIDKPNNK